ncbi:hypothetical protein [Vibrio sp. AND4]|uniref:hypothetical protein n=1 Tax=Vibrio sp. AND4 TaxID=314289 RepID=UPI00015EFFB2|nr:hypothetical protein [Vibrio sp. AND4]EDP59443.1 hypothetical protein AND4_09727 [Vibrio sp. AND4]
MRDWIDKITAGTAYLCSVFGIAFSQVTMEHLYFLSSIVLGVIMACVNIWHKRNMQRIAKEKGVVINETG